MKTFSKLAILSALLATSGSLALAETISLGSFATGTTATSLGFSTTQTALNFAGYTATATAQLNPTNQALQSGIAPTYALTSVSPWAAPLGNSAWVGSVPNSGPAGTNSPAYGYYQFNTLFSAAGGSYNGTLSVLGDDTVEVLLNGSVLAPFVPVGSPGAINFTSAQVIPLANLNLLSGLDANVFTFIVDQAGLANGHDASGVSFTSTLVSSVAPEPSSLMLLGTGLISAGAMFRRRRSVI